MKIITRYIFKELIKSFLLGFSVFSFLLFLNNLLYLIDLLISKNTPVITVLTLTVYFIVLLLPFTIPVGMLFGIILTYGRFSQDNEIIALRAVGVNTFKFIWQPFVLGILLCLFLAHVNLNTIPHIHQKFRKVYLALIQKQTAVKFEDKTFITLGSYRIYINKVNKKTGNLYGINIYKLDKISTRIFAKEGKSGFSTNNGVLFTLKDGIIQKSMADEPDKLTQFAFKEYKISIPIESKAQISTAKTLKEFSGKDLLVEMDKNKKKNIPSIHLETEFFTRLSTSFAVLSFCIIGIPLGIRLQRGTKSLSAGASIGVVTVFYFLLIASTTLAEKTVFPARYIMWLSNLSILVPGIILNFFLLKK